MPRTSQRAVASTLPAMTRKSCVSGDVRKLCPPASADAYYIHKTPIDTGATSQVFAGLGPLHRPVVFKRLSMLEPSPGKLRALLRDAGDSTPTAGSKGTQLSYEQSDIMSAAEILNELNMTRLAGDSDVALLVTAHSATGQPSKGFLLLRPSRADLLGHVHALADQPASRRIEMTHLVLQHLCKQLEDFHAQGLVHRDIRAENLFCYVDGNGDPQIRLGDFGKAKHLRDTLLLQHRKRDADGLGRVALMLLMPERRETIASHLPEARVACSAAFPTLWPVIAALLAGQLTLARERLQACATPLHMSRDFKNYYMSVADKECAVTERAVECARVANIVVKI